MKEIADIVGNMDIYLFDQVLKGRIKATDKILDAGCGSGRNSYYFLKKNYNIYGIDPREEALLQLKENFSNWDIPFNASHFFENSIEDMPFDNSSFDWIICNAVMHFAQNKAHFEKMLFAMWRVLRPQGCLFIRLASSIGIEQSVFPLLNGQYLLRDESIRFLVDYPMISDYTKLLDAQLFEPIKTVQVAQLRAMTTWCLQKK